MAELLVDSGRHRGRKVRLSAGETLVGRDAACPIRLATADVSRRHCKLTVTAGPAGEVLTVEDLGSRNGTTVNGAAIAGPTVLNAGDTLRIGPVQFLLPDPDAASESEVVNWLVPPPAAGTVSGDEPTEGDTQISDAPTTTEGSGGDAAAPPPPDPAVLEAAAVIRERHAALAAR